MCLLASLLDHIDGSDFRLSIASTFREFPTQPIGNAGQLSEIDMRFKLGCRLDYQIAGSIPFIFNIQAQTVPGQTVEDETLTITPHVDFDHWTMPESGNRYFRINPSKGPLKVEYTATVNLTSPLDDPSEVRELSPSTLPLSALPQLYPSRYCQSDRLARFATSTFKGIDPGYSRVNAICNWINEYVEYEGGVSDEMTSAFDTVTQRAGVCRDFAHLGIALCRALGIMRRYMAP